MNINQEIEKLSKERQQINDGVQAHVNCGGGYMIMQGHINKAEALRQKIEELKAKRDKKRKKRSILKGHWSNGRWAYLSSEDVESRGLKEGDKVTVAYKDGPKKRLKSRRIEVDYDYGYPLYFIII